MKRADHARRQPSRHGGMTGTVPTIPHLRYLCELAGKRRVARSPTLSWHRLTPLDPLHGRRGPE